MVRMNTRFDVLKEPKKTNMVESTKEFNNFGNKMRHNSKRTKSYVTSSRSKLKENGFTMNKTELHNAFPRLANTQKKSTPTPTTMNFAEATRPEELDENNVDEVDPGWVKLTRVNNKTQCQYNKQSSASASASATTTEEVSRNGLDASQQEGLYKLTEHWQNYRDQQNTLYPNSSPFMNEKSLLDPLSDDCYETESDYSESDESIEDPDELYDDM